MILRFCIYYSDGSTYSGDPFLAPQTGVQVVVTEDPKAKDGFVTKSMRDAFFWDGERWRSCDEPGMWDYLLEFEGPKAVLFGRWMKRDEDFYAIKSRARKEGLG